MYEAYGPNGVAILISAFTDNKNRTTQEVKHLLAKHGVNLAPPGSALWAFTKTGGIYAPNEPLIEIVGADEETVCSLLEVLDTHDDVQQVFTNARDYENTD